MNVKVVVPQIGQSIAEATIVKWLKKPGDSVQKGEVLVEIGTDKINTEIPAPESGTVARLLVPEGETVPVQSEIAVIEVAGEAAGTAAVHNAGETPAVHNAGETPAVHSAVPQIAQQTCAPQSNCAQVCGCFARAGLKIPVLKSSLRFRSF